MQEAKKEAFSLRKPLKRTHIYTSNRVHTHPYRGVKDRVSKEWESFPATPPPLQRTQMRVGKALRLGRTFFSSSPPLTPYPTRREENAAAAAAVPRCSCGFAQAPVRNVRKYDCISFVSANNKVQPAKYKTQSLHTPLTPLRAAFIQAYPYFPCVPHWRVVILFLKPCTEHTRRLPWCPVVELLRVVPWFTW